MEEEGKKEVEVLFSRTRKRDSWTSRTSRVSRHIVAAPPTKVDFPECHRQRKKRSRERGKEGEETEKGRRGGWKG